MLTTIATVAEEAGHVAAELPMHPVFFGLIAFGALTALAVVTFSFRDVANRHASKAEAFAREHGEGAQH